MPWRKPKFFYNNGIDVLTASPSGASDPSILIDGLDGTLWKAPDTAARTIKHDKGTLKKHAADFLTIAGHNFSSALPDISLQYSDSDGSYQTALTIPAKASFSRASVAYDSAGNQVGTNVPVYEADQFGGKALMCMSQTTNLLSANQASVETDLTGLLASSSQGQHTLVRDTTTAHFGNASAKLTSNFAGTQAQLNVYTSTIAISPNTAYSASVFTKLSPSAIGKTVRVQLTWYTGGSVFISEVITASTAVAGIFTRLAVSGTSPATAALAVVTVVLLSAAQNDSIWWDAAQLEARAWPTAWHEPSAGARAFAVLSVPVSGALNPQEGTISLLANINDNQKTLVPGRKPTVLMVGAYTDPTVQLYHSESDATWRFFIKNNTEISAANSLTPNGWHRFTVSWSAGSMRLYIDGVPRGSIASPTVPTAAITALYCGSADSGGWNLDGSVDDLQIWSRQLTDAEVAANHARNKKASAHPSSRAFFNFDDNLVNGVLHQPIILQEFTKIESRYQQLVITPSAAPPAMALAYWGAGKELDYVDADFDPLGVEYKANFNVSETGYVTGIHQKYIERAMVLGWDAADDWLYQIIAAWEARVGLGLFVVGWELEQHPDDVFLMRSDAKFNNPLTNGGAYRDIRISLRGRR